MRLQKILIRQPLFNYIIICVHPADITLRLLYGLLESSSPRSHVWMGFQEILQLEKYIRN